jgi:hypothetical protein
MSIDLLQSSAAVPTAAPARLGLDEVRARIERARPGLLPETPDYRAAVLLLLLPSFGQNVDRLVRRTGYSRVFVAQCLRRLFDNAWWEAGGGPASWCPDVPTCRSFWLDVDVALGQQLRRIGEGGRPEWAAAGSWVKAFEYRSARGEDGATSNEYRAIALHNPEPVLAEEENGQDPAAAKESAPMSDTPSAGSGALWLGQPPATTDALASATTPAPAIGGSLVDAWATADWLGEARPAPAGRRSGGGPHARTAPRSSTPAAAQNARNRRPASRTTGPTIMLVVCRTCMARPGSRTGTTM